MGAAGSAISQNTTKTVKAFEVITDADLMTTAKELGIESKFIWLKVFAIILLVVAVLLVLYSIVMLLKNLNVIKSSSKVFNIVGISLIALFVVSAIAMLIASNVYASAFETATTDMLTSSLANYISMIKMNVSAKLGVYQPIVLTTAVVSALCVSVFEIKNLKDN